MVLEPAKGHEKNVKQQGISYFSFKKKNNAMQVITDALWAI